VIEFFLILSGQRHEWSRIPIWLITLEVHRTMLAAVNGRQRIPRRPPEIHWKPWC